MFLLLLFLSSCLAASEPASRSSSRGGSRPRTPVPEVVCPEDLEAENDIICEAALALVGSFNRSSPTLVIPHIRNSVQEQRHSPDRDLTRISSDLVRRRSGEMIYANADTMDFLQKVALRSVLAALEEHRVQNVSYEQSLENMWSKKKSTAFFGFLTSCTSTIVGLIVYYNK